MRNEVGDVRLGQLPPALIKRFGFVVVIDRVGPPPMGDMEIVPRFDREGADLQFSVQRNRLGGLGLREL